jgi:hypothetical protein
MEEMTMFARIDARFSEPVDNPEDRKPLQSDELLTLLDMALQFGYSVKSAHDMKLPYDEVSSELFAVWYAKENEICIFADNVPSLIELTGWKPGSRANDRDIEQDVYVAQAA